MMRRGSNDIISYSIVEVSASVKCISTNDAGFMPINEQRSALGHQ